MSLRLKETDFSLALNYISASTGMDLPSTNYSIVKNFLEEKLQSGSINCECYLKLVNSDREEYYRFIDAVTINETYFFREEKHFSLLREELPSLSRKSKPVNIWSAACSSGEEAISLYLTAKDILGDDHLFRVSGSDISNKVLSKFKQGEYRKNSFREDGRRFHGLIGRKPGYDEHTFILDPDIIKKINIKNINLYNLNGLVFSQPFDVIFLRNTLIYFNIENRTKIISSIIKNLKPGGLLFLSSAEMPLISHIELKLMENMGVYYFRKKNPEEKSGEKNISETLLMSIQEDKTREKESVPTDVPRICMEAADPDLVLEYACNKINNRIFSLSNNLNYKLALILIKIIYSINNNDISAANALVDELESLSGENSLTYYLKGYTALVNGTKEKAFSFFTKVLSADPDFWPAGFFASSIMMETRPHAARGYIEACISGIKKYINSNSYRYQILLEGFNGKYFLRICEQWLKRV